MFASLLMGHGRPLDLGFTPLEVAGVAASVAIVSLVSHTVKTIRLGGLRGWDAEKKAVGLKRLVAVDSLGLVWAMLVTPADDKDRDARRWLLADARRWLPRVQGVIADRGFSKRFVEFVRRVCR